jgi:hypothetical protein
MEVVKTYDRKGVDAKLEYDTNSIIILCLFLANII